MNTLLFLLFCLAVGYVCVWVIVNERNGSEDGDWGFIAMRKPRRDKEPVKRDAVQESRGWKP